MRRVAAVLGFAAWVAACSRPATPPKEDSMRKTEDEWKAKLTPEQYLILRRKGTEAPGSGRYLNCVEPGTYVCAACGSALFSSESKYDSGCGWPAFGAPIAGEAVGLNVDSSRVEAVCSKCGSHLGHLFDDERSPTGKRY